MQVSGKGAFAGLVFDMMTGAFPIGTAIGAFAKNVLNFDAGDLNRAYEPGRGSRDAQFDYGDLKGMASGLMGKVEGWLGDLGIGQPRPEPNSDETALSMARPRTDRDAEGQARQKSGLGGWGKALLWGGAAIAGLSLLNNLPFFGGFGMPFYGAGMMMNSMMYNPAMSMMMPGMWW